MGNPNIKDYGWKKGQSGNPGGRAPLPEHLKLIKSITALEINKIISKYGRMTYPELALAVHEKTLPVLDLAVATVFINSIEKGDYNALNFLLDRCIGKPAAIQIDENELTTMTVTELVTQLAKKLPEAANLIKDEVIQCA